MMQFYIKIRLNIAASELPGKKLINQVVLA